MLISFVIPGDEKIKELKELISSVKVMRNFTSLPGFPRPLRKVVMALKDFVGVPLDEKTVAQIMTLPNITEIFKILELPETEKHFEGKFQWTSIYFS